MSRAQTRGRMSQTSVMLILLLDELRIGIVFTMWQDGATIQPRLGNDRRCVRLNAALTKGTQNHHGRQNRHLEQQNRCSIQRTG